LLHITHGSDGQWAAEPVWTGRNKMATQFSNVVLAHNCVFGLDCRELACFDLETGERKWKGKTYNFGQVMLVGDLIVVQAEDGVAMWPWSKPIPTNSKKWAAFGHSTT
jgi:hypothetical protein